MVTFIHLSDIHFRNRDHLTQFDIDLPIRRALLEDIEQHPADGAAYDALLLTGDIAFSGQKVEYERAQEFLNEIFTRGGVPRESTFCVPGNHDIDRNYVEPDLPLWAAHQALRQSQDPVVWRDHLYKQLVKDPQHSLLAPLKAYNDFAQGYGCFSGMLPPKQIGETARPQLSWQRTFKTPLEDGTLVRLNGLNSALISDAGDAPGKLLVSDFQTTELQHTANVIDVVMCHHPPEWLPGYVQSHIFDALDRLELPQQDWAQVLGAMFIAATFISIPQAVEKAGPLAMQGAFRWLDHEIAQTYVPSDGWRSALAKSAEQLLQATDELAPAPLALCAWCLSPDTARRVLSGSRRDVQHLAEHLLDQIPGPLLTPTAFLLMTIGLRTLDRAGVPLISQSFFLVHNALATRNYGAEPWWLLSTELPYLGMWHDWDRCEKLRQAVCLWFQNQPKSAKALLAAASNKQERDLARRVLKDKGPPSQEFLD